jgi:hypothetical protein
VDREIGRKLRNACKQHKSNKSCVYGKLHTLPATYPSTAISLDERKPYGKEDTRSISVLYSINPQWTCNLG